MVATEKQTGQRHSHQLNDLTAIYSLIYLVDSVKAQAQSLHGTHAVQLRRTWRAFGPLQQWDNWPTMKHEWRDSVGTQRGGHSALSDLRARCRKVWVEHGWNNNGGEGRKRKGNQQSTWGPLPTFQPWLCWWVTVLCPTWHKRFRHVLPSRSLVVVLKKLNQALENSAKKSSTLTHFYKYLTETKHTVRYYN